MSEDEKFSVDTENLKNETKETVNQVKDTIKNVDLKKDAEATKGFLMEMISNPIETVKRIATGEENVLSKVVILMVVFIVASVLYKIIYLFRYAKYSRIGDNILGLVASVLNPAFYILAPAIIILLMNKSKKSLTTVISTLVVASVPIILNRFISAIEVLIRGISIVTSPISTAFSAIALVLSYFGIKELFEEEEDKTFLYKFAIIKLLAAFILVILARIGIY